jgi:Rrf2 family transcriptional regulator, cysteine metabolism repressor
MKVSQKVDYGLRALLELATRSARTGPVRSADIAQRTRIPEKFLEAILVDLRKAGLIESRRGPEGGHRLARAPAAITLADIRAAVDGPLALSPARRETSSGATEVAVRSVWEEVDRGVGAVLQGVTLEDVLRRAELHRVNPDFAI